MNVLVSFIAGLVFGTGLLLAGMSNPAKVLGFLDLAGAWDPSLAFVMAGAVAVGVLAFAWVRRHTLSLLGLPVQLPNATQVDRRLIVGNLMFGVGWGLAGICPGPAVTLIGAGIPAGWIFGAALLGGMLLFELVDRTPRGIAARRA